ncbi:MAG: AAA family ATPase, partial [Nitrospirae bacterium]|nr:AAA family ATPase [Nitrospirota bacterium]
MEENKHFSEITVVDYRVFKDLTFKNLSKINLIVGENNTGKTAFLEAVGLLIGQNVINNLDVIYTSRWKFLHRLSSKQYLHTQLKDELDGESKKVTIKGIYDNKESEFKIEGYHEEGVDSKDINRNEYLFTLKLTSIKNGEKRIGKSRIFLNPDPIFNSEKESDPLCKYWITNSFRIIDENNKRILYEQAKKEGLYEEIIEFIKINIDPKIEDITHLPLSERFFVTPSKLDLTSYGEGLQKIYFTAMMFAAAKNGVVLIDELENGIHVDLLAKFIGFIFKLADEFNVQVFFTTHSQE